MQPLIDVAAIYPEAVKPRIYPYPVNHERNPWMAVIEWGSGGMARRVYAHYRHNPRTGAWGWVGGRPAHKPESGWSLYGSDRWQPLGPVYLVATEREAAALESIGADATTWDGPDIRQARFADWTSLDGRLVLVWTDARLHRPLAEHLWRHGIVPPEWCLPIEWMRRKWEEHGGDKGRIWEDLWWAHDPQEQFGLAGAGEVA